MMMDGFELPEIKHKRNRKKTGPRGKKLEATLNSETYYIGEPCHRNHSGKRYTKGGECVECRSLKRKGKYQQRNREWELKKNFGITESDYNELLIDQDGKCKICNQPERVKLKNGNVKRLAVDHCHDTGKIRGLLCYACNIAIGLFNHESSRLRVAAFYCEATK